MTFYFMIILSLLLLSFEQILTGCEYKEKADGEVKNTDTSDFLNKFSKMKKKRELVFLFLQMIKNAAMLVQNVVLQATQMNVLKIV